LEVTIFYCWQSDTRAAANRTFIQEALEAAAEELRADDSITIEPVIDRDTLAVPGAPDIASTILQKIDASAAIVADVTIVNSGSKHRPTPNPNVLVELGYALKALTPRRAILVQNTAFGGPEDLPFDLRQKRVLTYSSPEDAPTRAHERQRLQAALREALRSLLADLRVQRPTAYPVELSIDYEKVNIRSERHDYRLQVALVNQGTRPITEWHVDVVVPTRLLERSETYFLRVSNRSDEDSTLFRASQETHPGAIYPEDRKLVMTVDYHVDHAIYWKERGLFDKEVTAKAYVHGELAATAERVVRELQIF
jgi:hypothetical protein